MSDIVRPELFVPSWPERESFVATPDNPKPFEVHIQAWMDSLDINPLVTHPNADNNDKLDTRLRRHAFGTYMGEVLQTASKKDAVVLGLTVGGKFMIENQWQRTILVAVTRFMDEETSFADVDLAEAMTHAGNESDKVADKIPTMKASGKSPIYTDTDLQKSMAQKVFKTNPKSELDKYREVNRFKWIRDERNRDLGIMRPAKWVEAVVRREIAMIGVDLSYRANGEGFLDYKYDDQHGAAVELRSQTG